MIQVRIILSIVFLFVSVSFAQRIEMLRNLEMPTCTVETTILSRSTIPLQDVKSERELIYVDYPYRIELYFSTENIVNWCNEKMQSNDSSDRVPVKGVDCDQLLVNKELMKTFLLSYAAYGLARQGKIGVNYGGRKVDTLYIEKQKLKGHGCLWNTALANSIVMNNGYQLFGEHLGGWD